MKMHDLGSKPSKPTAMDSDRKYYPSTRVPLAAIKGAPTDGSEFTVTMKCCVRSVDNRDDAADIEFKGIALAKGNDSTGSDDAGDTKSRFPRRSLKESMEKATAGKGEEY